LHPARDAAAKRADLSKTPERQGKAIPCSRLALTFVQSLPGELTQAAVTRSLPGFVSGISDTTAIYGGDISEPTSWGTGGVTLASSSFGDVVGLDHTKDFIPSCPRRLYVRLCAFDQFGLR
jgi:hypothetical protein